MYSASASICSPGNEITPVLLHILVVVADEVDRKLCDPNANDDVGIDSVTDVFPPARSQGPIFLPSNDGRLSPIAVECAPVVELCVRRFVRYPLTDDFFGCQKNRNSNCCRRGHPGTRVFECRLCSTAFCICSFGAAPQESVHGEQTMPHVLAGMCLRSA